MLATKIILSLACVMLVGVAHAQLGEITAPEPVTREYNIHVPPMMIRGETYQGLITSNLPAARDDVFRFGTGSGDIILPDSVVMEAGTNHALFTITPIHSTILSGQISTEITVIRPDGEITVVETETHPGVGAMSRLWIVGPGVGGATCDAPRETSASAVAERAADGVFDVPNPDKEIRTRLSSTTIHVFLTDRYCTPVTAPPGGTAFTVSSNTPSLTFGGGRTHVTGVIPEGFNSAVLDVGLGKVGGSGVIYATGSGVSPDAIKIENEPIGITVHLGVGPSTAMESSFVTWHVWIERDGKQYVPEGPVPIYLTTDNPILASFDQSLIDATGVVFGDIRPHHAFMVDGSASGVLYTGTPASVGDLRLLAGDRDIEVYAHIPGYGSASTSFRVGMPGATGSEFQVNTDQVQECIKEQGVLPDGFYSSTCNEMWHRLLVASHFFDIEDAGGEPLDTADDTIDFLNSLFGGDNTESGTALFTLVDRINEYSISDRPTGGLAGELTTLLGNYLQTTEVTVEPVSELGLTAEMLERMPTDPPPNELVLEAFPGKPGTSNVVVSTIFSDGSFTFPVYMPDGTVTLSSDSGLIHPPEIRTYGSAPKYDTPGTRPSVVVVPVTVQGGGTFTASLGGVGSYSVSIDDIAPSEGKRLHVSTLPGSGDRDMIAILSVVDADGLLTNHNGDIYVEAGQGASDVELVGWRGGGGIIRGSVSGVGEIIIHAPGLGGGTALTTPVRHETALDVWYPDRVHVGEAFPVVAHTLDADGQPVARADVLVSGNVAARDGGLVLNGDGERSIIVEHRDMFHAGALEGFLNKADVSVATTAGSLVELNDTVTVYVDTGVMNNPHVILDGDGLLFSGERAQWETRAGKTGSYDVTVSVNQDGWETFKETVSFRVSEVLNIEYDAITEAGMRADATLTLCGVDVLAGSFHTMEAASCVVSVPDNIQVSGVEHELVTLTVNGMPVSSGTTTTFNEDAVVEAIYRGVISVTVNANYPDDTSVELFWDLYAPGDRVRVTADPRYELWGLIWDRPDRWTGLPAGALRADGVAEWTAVEDVDITVEYRQDMTYLLMVMAGVLGVPVVFMFRNRLRGLRFK